MFYTCYWPGLRFPCDTVCQRLVTGSVVFSRYSGYLHQQHWPPQYNWNIVESGVQHHKPRFPYAFDFIQTSHFYKERREIA